MKIRPPSPPGRPHLVCPVRVDPRGVAGPTPDEARGPGWRRTSHGFYVPAEVSSDDTEQRILEASAVVPDGLGITGWAALRWLGGRWFDGVTPAGGRRPVVIAIGTHDIRPQPKYGIAVTGEGLDPRMVIRCDGVPVTLPVWSVSFEMRYANTWRRAVVVLDMAAYSDLVSLSEQWAFLSHQQGWTGIPQGRKSFGFASENAWSPQEVLMRQVWEVDAGLPRPLCNVPIFDLNGRHLGTPDLFDPAVGLMGEYDGADHLRRRQRSRDVRRGERLRSYELESVTMMADDFADVPAFVARLHEAYRRAASRPVSGRSWTLTQPDWWIPTETVAQRRALAESERQRLLRNRVA